MRRTVIAFAALALLAGCAVIVIPDDGDVQVRSSFSSNAVQGNGQVVTEQREIGANIDGIDLNGPMQVEMRVGAAPSLKVEGDSNLLPLLRTDASAGALRVWIDGSIRSTSPLRVTVTTPHLRQIRANGSGRLQVSGLDEGDLDVDLNGSRGVQLSGRVHRLDARLNGSGGLDAHALESGTTQARLNGSGRLQLGRLQGESLVLELRGSGGANASGNVERLSVRLNGSGSADLASLTSRDADLSTRGSGSITAAVSQSLVADSTGSGRVTVYGNPGQRSISGKHVSVLQ